MPILGPFGYPVNIFKGACVHGIRLDGKGMRLGRSCSSCGGYLLLKQNRALATRCLARRGKGAQFWAILAPHAGLERTELMR